MNALAVCGALVLCGCQHGHFDFARMLAQKKATPFTASSVFADGIAMRQPPSGTFSREAELGPSELTEGQVDGTDVRKVPLALTHELFERGENRFGIFCAPCHGVLGDGHSEVAKNMTLRPPPSLHEPRIQALPDGRLFSVVTHGYGLMPPYAWALPVNDRWAVVAYVRALELSQHVALGDLPPDARKEAEPWLK
ncbi:MAG TPA: cytochrome c [Polyangiaceae bacterium]|nr:cytochrome c [Polyangiaceae bacterium]